jgi:YspA, cpYpsA-related SLOG family
MKNKGIKLIVAGSRHVTDYNLVKEAIEQGLEQLKIEKVSEIVSGHAKGVDQLGEDWGRSNGINVVTFPAKWDDLKAEGAIVKERVNPWTKKKEKYNANAGFARNKEMAEYADALIAVDLDTNGTNDMIKQAKAANLKVYQYKPAPLQDDEFDYKF